MVIFPSTEHKVLMVDLVEYQEVTNDDALEKTPQYTTIYVGNIVPKASISIVFTLVVLKSSYLSWSNQKKSVF